MKKFCLVVVFFMSMLSASFASSSSITNKDVEQFIKNMSGSSQSILNNKNLTARQQEDEYKVFTEGIVDTNWVARFILGNYWKEITPQQRTEFQVLYKEYLLGNYMPKLKNYNKELIITKIEKQRETVYMVYTRTKDADNRNIDVNFRLIEKENKLFITDIIPEGISFISSQRTDVGTSIMKNGYDNFIKDLKVKIKNQKN